MNALYSTPSIYTDAKNAANQPWPLKTDDYFPYGYVKFVLLIWSSLYSDFMHKHKIDFWWLMMAFIIGMRMDQMLIGQAISLVGQRLSDMLGSLVDTIWYD